MIADFSFKIYDVLTKNFPFMGNALLDDVDIIEKDKKEYEIIELVNNWEYENDVHTYAYKEEVYSNKLKEEVNIWKEGTLALAA